VRTATCILCIVGLFAVLVPVAGAVPDTPARAQGTPFLDRDNPELIAALRHHTAYVGDAQQARMDGVIRYIDLISGGAGAYQLRWIMEDYLAAAASVPLMNTSDEIGRARGEMQLQSGRFVDETRIQMAIFDGNAAGLAASINASVQAVEDSFSGIRDSVWLVRDSARLTAFLLEAEERDEILRDLGRRGADTTEAQKISEEIDRKRPDLEAILRGSRKGSIEAVNSGIKQLNGQFRSTVERYRAELGIRVKAAAIMAGQG
jgi:hypothetical protein